MNKNNFLAVLLMLGVMISVGAEVTMVPARDRESDYKNGYYQKASYTPS